MKNTLLLLGAACCAYAHAQTTADPLSLRPALLTAGSATWSTVFSATQHPAAAAPSTFAIGAAGERRFGMAELGSYALASVLPVRPGIISLGAGSGGTELRTTRFSLGYGRPFGSLLRAGMQFHYYSLGTGIYRATALAVDAGVLLRLAEGVQSGLLLRRVAATQPDKEGATPFRGKAAVSFSWEMPQQWLLAAAVERSDDAPVSVIGGLGYALGRKLRLQAGIDTGAEGFYFGTSYQLGSLQLQMTALCHRRLGVTPGLLIAHAKAE